MVLGIYRDVLLRCGFAGVVLLSVSFAVTARIEPQPYVSESGLAILPAISVGYEYDDNITLAQENTTSSNIVSFDAGVKAKAERQGNVYQAAYKIALAEYLDSSIDSYIDHLFSASAEFDFALRHRGSLAYQFSHEHEQRGRGISQGLGDELDELIYFRTNQLRANYSYGALKATGRIDFNLSWENKDYRNLLEVTQFRSWEQMDIGGTFFYRVSSATELLFEGKQIRRRYKNQAPVEPSRDNDDRFLFVGASWDITGKSTGSAKIGYEDKRYKSADRPDFQGLSWLVSLDYLPREYSKINLFTSRAARDPDQFGNYIEEEIYRLTWEHYWLQRLSSNIRYQYIDKDYSGDERLENIVNWSLSLAYDLRRWLRVSAGYKREDKDASIESIKYRQNAVFINFTGTL